MSRVRQKITVEVGRRPTTPANPTVSEIGGDSILSSLLRRRRFPFDGDGDDDDVTEALIARRTNDIDRGFHSGEGGEREERGREEKTRRALFARLKPAPKTVTKVAPLRICD